MTSNHSVIFNLCPTKLQFLRLPSSSNFGLQNIIQPDLRSLQIWLDQPRSNLWRNTFYRNSVAKAGILIGSIGPYKVEIFPTYRVNALDVMRDSAGPGNEDFAFGVFVCNRFEVQVSQGQNPTERQQQKTEGVSQKLTPAFAIARKSHFRHTRLGPLVKLVLCLCFHAQRSNTVML